MSAFTDLMQAGGGVASVAVAYLAWRASTEANRISIASQAREDEAGAAAIQREEEAQAAADEREKEAEKRAHEREDAIRKQLIEEARLQPLERAIAFAKGALQSYSPYGAKTGLTANIGKTVPRPVEVTHWLERAQSFESQANDPEIARVIAKLREVIQPIELQDDWSNAAMRGSVRNLTDAGEPVIREAEELLVALKTR